MKIIECPRDAMQGLDAFIPTADKIGYLNKLLEVGFHTIDAGSFVSPKAIPQLRDTATVLDSIDWEASSSSILVIVANTRGAEQAVGFEAVRYLGFPLSISETFQQRNTNKSIPEALNTLNEIQDLCVRKGKELVTYISMGFGNPYGDPYNTEMVAGFVDILKSLGVNTISLSDTIGVASPDQIHSLYTSITNTFPTMEVGLHLHSNPATAEKKIEAAFRAGCRRLDGALKGFGGCPMAEDVLVGNIATETIIAYLDTIGATPQLNRPALGDAMILAQSVFPS
jgi:hydroxymethylglutaryl-CoA lyase